MNHPEAARTASRSFAQVPHADRQDRRMARNRVPRDLASARRWPDRPCKALDLTAVVALFTSCECMSACMTFLLVLVLTTGESAKDSPSLSLPIRRNVLRVFSAQCHNSCVNNEL